MDDEGLAGGFELFGLQAAGDDAVLAGEEVGHGARADLVGGVSLGGVGVEDVPEPGVGEVAVVGGVFDPRSSYGAPRARDDGEDQEGQHRRVQDGDDGRGGGHLGRGGGQELGVEDEVAGLFRAVGGGGVSVLEVGVLVRDELGGGRRGDDFQVGLAHGLRREPGGRRAGGGVEQVAGGCGEGEHNQGGQVFAQNGGDVVPGEDGGQDAGGGRERGRGEYGGAGAPT
ncbi:hypothetical protein OG978_44045 (plasmid) [Streptomyces sp. NBC_01591]|uniref:hypothetical protein n=1 Tax=Streptomyces sp. NBC_01591 TaxID=2975888 RepID=UPI002DD8827D|nr:hypothetical protein [Streptomyces sp. NBC_01591]WSD74111.1 hypothetical protein OG978_44045 [Streptomyces sp. NBC_01591]